MNATLVKAFHRNGACAAPAGATGRVITTVCDLDTGEADYHVVDFPSGAMGVPAAHCRLHAEALLPGAISPEQQIANVLQVAVKLVDGPSFPGRVRAIGDAVHQLADMWPRYQRGELPLIVDALESPF